MFPTVDKHTLSKLTSGRIQELDLDSCAPDWLRKMSRPRRYRRILETWIRDSIIDREFAVLKIRGGWTKTILRRHRNIQAAL